MAHHRHAFNCSVPPYDARKEAVKRLAFIELNMVLMVSGAVALVVFGSCRRYCSNVLFDKIQWMNYFLVTNVLFTLTVGEMVGAPFRNVLFAVWGAILLNTTGGADSFSSYGPADNEQWKSVTAQTLFRSLLMSTLLGYALTTAYGKTILVISILLSAKRIDERAVALKMATKSSLARTTKNIADFMAGEHEIPVTGVPDPTRMKGYNYLVSGDTKWTASPPSYHHHLEVRDCQVVTLQKIWQCDRSLLTGESGQRLKDICLSFALFRLLCRRFGGHPFSESSQAKTWKLVGDGLFSKEGDYESSKEVDYERAFRVIEVELNFLFDLFYTKYAVIFKNGQGLQKLKIFNAVLLLSGCCVLGLLIINLDTYCTNYEEVTLVTANKISVDKVVTTIILVLLFLMEIAQLLLLVVSNWATMLWICNSMRKDTYFMFWPKIIMFCQDRFKPWERKLGQYSLLKSFNRNPWRLKFECLLMFLFSGVIDLPRPGQKGKARIKLPEEVKEAVMISLRGDKKESSERPRLSNIGEKSLGQNEVSNELSWACRLDTPTHVILVWHVATSLCMFHERSSTNSVRDKSLWHMATSLCMFGESKRSPTNSVKSNNFIIASALSGYCSYLVAFAPRLICDNPIVCEFIFDMVIKEAGEILQNCNSESEMHEKILGGGENETIIYKGAKLAEELLQLPNGKDKWKVLADFWAELMLFLAPSGDPMAHVEHLAKGGEFVTHLWALLSHAGILNQCPTSHDV
ncbi:hypothetical protein SLA2020_331730 [Shorea laevis]